MDQSQEVDKANDPQLQMQTLEMANKKMTEEFNAQRAKMKDLFLQKEAELSRKHEENNLLMDQLKKLKNELDDVKSQLVVDSMRESDFEDEKRKAEEEIASLQRLIHETVEESSSNRSLYDHDLQKLQAYIQYLQKENEQLKHQNNQYQQQSTSQEHSLAPSVMINALTKGIAKKLDAFGGSQDEKSEKTLEDIEVLRSLVDPLEEQIRALKEKLRATDEQLQKCRECRHLVNESIKPTPNQTPEKTNLQISASTNTSFEMPKSDILPCDMCSNYEAQLVKEQQHVNELKLQVLVAEKAADRHKEDLLKEIGFRKEMEEKWNEKREEHKQQVAELTRTTDCTQQDLIELRQYFNQVSKEMSAELLKLTKDREQIYHDLDKLQTENENLVGKYTIHSQQLQSEFIDLPDTVEELHELVLKNQQELIITKVGKEAAEDNVKSLQSKIDLLNSQIAHYKHEKKAVAESADIEIKYLREQIEILEKEKKQYLAKNVNIKEREEQIKQLSDNIVKLQNQNHELKTRLHSQQEDLENAEAVQRDLVKLSQNLQIQFEKIREADHQVRWQHEEDIEECSNCHIPFSNSKRKQHCRHCGQIFCPNCVARVVQSGPNMRPSHVCDVCYTLLVKTSAPYFSKELPTT
ncbi:rab GTPase-binding effector protein 1 isoform X2 [Dendroctonus ponderosae]|uniref:rab GTPase-binding effector protein 1 isoform X2 n=1 Tax=Dendroctonus ponderosae TaxID=77166 RepID=UPI002035CF0B|nr:rab GTPase-binding effector protein 1 isoform X2 [Dendroctonus ponderosae]